MIPQHERGEAEGMMPELEVIQDPCFSCISRREVPGDAHITCVNPVAGLVEIVTHGNVPVVQRERAAVLLVDEMTKKGYNVAAVTFWSDCGWYPLAYDGLIVESCANYVEGKGKHAEGAFGDMVETIKKRPVVPVIMKLNLEGKSG